MRLFIVDNSLYQGFQCANVWVDRSPLLYALDVKGYSPLCRHLRFVTPGVTAMIVLLTGHRQLAV